MVYDVIVVGAGPAGAILAYLLATQGLHVLIVEKSRLPRYKTCGGGLTYKAIQVLPFDVRDSVELEASGGIVTFAGRQCLKAEVQQPFAWLVMRDRFDHFLVQQAVKAGVHLVEGAPIQSIDQQGQRVLLKTGTDTYTAQILAGADGVNSLTARHAGLMGHRQVGTAVEVELAVPQRSIEAQGSYATFDFSPMPGGYGWVFPKRTHLSVGLYAAHPGKTVHLRSALDRFIKIQPVLQDSQPIQLHGHRIPLGGQESTLHAGRILLLGDAANLADPWLGEGIYYAILSALIAADEIFRFFRGGIKDLSRYTERINAQIVRQLSHARTFAAWVYRFPRIGTDLLSNSPLMQQIVFGAIRGDYTFRQLNTLLLQQLPRILVQAWNGGSR